MPENLAQHGNFLTSGGWAIINAQNDHENHGDHVLDTIDADTLAQEIENPKAVNLILLGFALAKSEQAAEGQGKLFCSLSEIKSVLENRFGKNQKMLAASLKALEAGFHFTGSS